MVRAHLLCDGFNDRPCFFENGRCLRYLDQVIPWRRKLTSSADGANQKPGLRGSMCQARLQPGTGDEKRVALNSRRRCNPCNDAGQPVGRISNYS